MPLTRIEPKAVLSIRIETPVRERLVALAAERGSGVSKFAAELLTSRLLFDQHRPLKVIFDRSAFHGARFDLLAGSRLLRLVQAGKIVVFHTSVFLEETLRMAASKNDDAHAELRRQWPFLRSICNGGLFKPLLFGDPPKWRSVCDEELGGGDKEINWPLAPSLSRNAIEAKVTAFLEGSGPLPELAEARPKYDQIEQVKKQNKATRFSLRGERTLRKGETFREYHQSVFEYAASLLILRPPELPMQLAALDQPQAKFDAWKRDPTKFPHFTAFVGFLIYSLYDAEKNQNSALDPNWQGDAEQLCFLTDVDAMISSDRGFMKDSFEALWQPSEKLLFTPEEFVALL